MITRPLDLASKLRPEPRSFDFLFYVNAGLIALMFYLFGSHFVLAPGLGLNFEVQEIPGARAGAVQTTHRITVTQSGQVFTDDGPKEDMAGLRSWLQKQAGSVKQPSLLIIADRNVAHGTISEIASAAISAGFLKVQEAAEEPAGERR